MLSFRAKREIFLRLKTSSPVKLNHYPAGMGQYKVLSSTLLFCHGWLRVVGMAKRNISVGYGVLGDADHPT